MPRILVVEDDHLLRASVSSVLRNAGYEIDEAVEGAAGVQALSHQAYDLVLLDIGLPFVDGWRILDTLEGRRLPSVIVISARGEERDKVRALDLGADDYLAKPFGADELLARVRALLRRLQPGSGPKTVLELGSVVIDLPRRSVTRAGVEVRLSPTEYGLLSELARSPGTVMDQRTLLTRVWGPGRAHERSYLRTFIQRLRSKLEEDPAHPELIITVGSRGYRLGP